MNLVDEIKALIEEDVRCDIHGDLWGHERVAEHLANRIDGYMKRIEELESVLRYIDSKLYVDDYGDYVFESGFSCGAVIEDALAGKKKDD